MEQHVEISPTATKELNSLKETVQTFIDLHQDGKGDARKSVIPALRSFVALNFQSVDSAYDKIFAVINEEMEKPYKKTPKMFGYLAGLKGELKANKALFEEKKLADEQKRLADENVSKLQQQLRDLQETQQASAAIPAAAEPKKRRNSRAKKAPETTLKQDSTIQLEKQLAEQTQRAQKLEQDLREKEAEAKRLLAGKNLDGAEDQKRFRLLEDEIRESKKAAKKYQTQLDTQKQEAEKLLAAKALEATQRETELKLVAQEKRLADLDAAEAKRKADLERQQNSHLEQLQKAGNKVIDALGLAEQKEKEKIRVAETRFNEGYEKGKEAGALEIVVFVDKVDQRHPELNLRKIFQETLALEGSNQTPSTTALVKFSEGRRKEHTSSADRPEFHSSHASSRQEPKSRMIITDKKTCMSILVQKRADLIGKPATTNDEVMRDAITQAAIEYFICDLLLRGKDKSMVAIRQNVSEFMKLIRAGECSTLLELMLDEDEKLTGQALTKEEANNFTALLAKNQLGFDSTQVTKLLSDYADGKCDLKNAETRLKQIFIRALEKTMIAAWLGTKYLAIKSLVDLYAKIKDGQDNESEIQRRQIKLAVFILVAHRDDQPAAKILSALQRMTALNSNVQKAIEDTIDPNEQISGTPLSVIDFQIFTALFAKANFFVFSERKVAEYFHANGGVYAEEAHRKQAETACVSSLRDGLPAPKQQAPANAGASSAMYKPEDPKKKADTKAPLVEAAVNYAATSMDL